MADNTGLDGYEAFDSQFADKGSERLRAMLDALELQMAMLSPAQQEFIIGTKAVFDTGGGITPEARSQVFEIARSLSTVGHETMSSEGTLSMSRVITDLASVQQRLTPQELEFAKQLSAKIKRKQTLSKNETLALVQLHSAKGF